MKRAARPALLLCCCLAWTHAAPVVVPDLPQEQLEEALPAAVAGQVVHLYDHDPLAQGKALVALAAMGGQAAPAVPYILCLAVGKQSTYNAHGGRVTIGALALDVLTTIGKDAPKALLPILRDPDSPHLDRALRAVVDSNEPEVTKQLLVLSNSPVRLTRDWAVAGLAPAFGDEQVAKQLTKILRSDPNEGVRASALRIVRNGPFKPGDPREPLLLAGLRDPAASVRSAALRGFKGEPSLELFLAVFKTLDKDCCSAVNCADFLSASVKHMREPLAKALTRKDARLRQKVHLILYYYQTPPPGEAFAKRLFADPSPAVRRGVLRHIAMPQLPALEHVGGKMFIHTGKATDIHFEMVTNKRVPKSWNRRDPRPALQHMVELGMASNDMEMVAVLLASKRLSAPIGKDHLSRAFAKEETRALALTRMPAASLTVEELLLALSETDRDTLQLALTKLDGSPHTDRRLVEKALAIAEAHNSLAVAACCSALRRQAEHLDLFLKRIMASPDAKLRLAGCEAVCKALPKAQARDILLDASRDTDTSVRNAAERALRRAYHIRGGVANPGGKAGEVEAEEVPENASAAAFARALGRSHKYKKARSGRTVKIELSPANGKRLVSLLEDKDPKLSDLAAELLFMAEHQAAAVPAISYLVYHHPRSLKYDLAGRFGAAAVLPLTALVLHHHSQGTRSEASKVLFHMLTRGEEAKELRQSETVRQALVMILHEAPDSYSRAEAIKLSTHVLPEKIRKSIFTKLRKEGKEYLNCAIDDALTPPGKRTIPSPDSTPAGIAELAASRFWGQRQQAVIYAGSAKWGPEIRQAVLPLVLDPDTRVSHPAASLLGNRLAKDEEATQWVRDRLASKSKTDQLAALRILRPVLLGRSRIDRQGEFQTTIQSLLKSDDNQVRLAAVKALRAAKGSRAHALLRGLLKDPNRAVAQAAFNLIASL